MLAVLLVMASIQTRLIFPAHAVGPAGPLPRGATLVSVATPNGSTLHGIHIPPVSAAPEPPNISAHSPSPGQARTLILGFGGNGWNGADVAAHLNHVFPDTEVVVFHYRGYSPSTGSPSAKALLADAPLVHDFAVDRIKPDRIVAVGFSIGSGVAASLAGRRSLDGLILVTPFDSLKAAASDLYPWLPVATLFEHELDTAAYLKEARVPVAIIAAERDTLIRPARTEALRRQVTNLVYDRTIDGAGHNDLYHRPEFVQAMGEALKAASSPGKTGGSNK